MEELEFDSLEPRSFKFQWAGEMYTAHEATEDAAVKFRNAALKNARLEDGRMVLHAHGLGDTEPLLVSLCVRDKDDKLVPESLVRSWPSRIVKPVFQKLREISDLVEQEMTPEKCTEEIRRLSKLRTKLLEGKRGNSPEARGTSIMLQHVEPAASSMS